MQADEVHWRFDGIQTGVVGIKEDVATSNTQQALRSGEGLVWGEPSSPLLPCAVPLPGRPHSSPIFDHLHPPFANSSANTSLAYRVVSKSNSFVSALSMG